MMSWLPQNVSTYGAQIDWLFYLIYYVTAATFFGVQICLLVFIFIYRDKGDRRATYTHGNTTLEIIWTAIPAALLVLLALMSRSTWAYIKETQPPTDFVIQVTAKQFNWEIAYPGADGKLDTEDDVKMDNEFHVPVDKTVRIHLKARDVIHSFFVPEFRLKQDAVPGRDIPVWFKATKPGKYEVPCAELCGFGHSGMVGFVHVDTQADYDAWAGQNNITIGVTTPAAG
jgi:cytochrome c oxidase subunit 2